MDKYDGILAELHASLDGRWMPETVADLILTGLHDLYTHDQRSVLSKVAAHSLRRRHGWSSMSSDYARPVDASHQLDTLSRLFGVGIAGSSTVASDPTLLRAVAGGVGEQIYWSHGDDNFKADRLDREERAAVWIDLPKRQYNRRWRFLARLEKKIGRLDRELRKRQLLLVGRSGLAADIGVERFRADPIAAAFVAYFVARRNVRRQFSLSGKTNPFDEVAAMLFERCIESETTDWWMISRVYSQPSVLAMLSDQERGELLGRWSALMRGAADILREAWDPSTDRTTMIVRRGMDSTTWNTIAQAYNTARAGWINVVTSANAGDLLDVALPGKVMRLMAADLAQWHRSSGSDVDPDTLVWSLLPLPWKVLDGTATCTRATVTEACNAAGVDPEAHGWTAPRATGSVAEFTPTPELVHGVSIADPAWAALLRSAGVFSGKPIRDGYEDVRVPADVVVSDLPQRPLV